MSSTLPESAAIALSNAAPNATYVGYDGGGAAICHGCRGRLDFSVRAVHVPTCALVSVCSICATSADAGE